MQIAIVLATSVVVTLAGCTSARADPTPACTADKRFDAGSRPTGKFFHATVTGKSADDVVKQIGPPSCQSTTLWRYRFPRGCSDERTTVSVWFRDGKVVRVNAVDEHTGQICE